jgi:hypothetical protein
VRSPWRHAGAESPSLTSRCADLVSATRCPNSSTGHRERSTEHEVLQRGEVDAMFADMQIARCCWSRYGRRSRRDPYRSVLAGGTSDALNSSTSITSGSFYHISVKGSGDLSVAPSDPTRRQSPTAHSVAQRISEHDQGPPAVGMNDFLYAPGATDSIRAVEPKHLAHVLTVREVRRIH